MTRNEQIALGAAALVGVVYLLRRNPSAAEKPKANGSTGTGSVWDNVKETSTAIWPIQPGEIRRVGQSVMADRGRASEPGRPHKGIDIFAKEDTEVRASQRGKVRQVTDGRKSTKQERRDAGLWVDIESSEKGNPIYRYLHLGEAYVKEGDTVGKGDLIGKVAPPYTSGLAADPHLHFEIRAQEDRDKTGYGSPIDPLTRLPKLQSDARV